MRASCLPTLPSLLLGALLPLLAGGEIMHPNNNVASSRIKRSVNVEKDPAYWNNKAQETVKQHLFAERIEGRAKNVILFLGDGMSIPTLTATRLYIGQKRGLSGEGQELSFEQFPYTGLSKTYCVDSPVADSACSATAYLCGVKANYGTLGVSARVARKDCRAQRNSSTHVTSVFQWAQDAGKATGLVTTTRVTHASPAGAYAHTANRDWESDAEVARDGVDPARCPDIAQQLVRSSPGHNFEVVLGGGRRCFRPRSTVDEEGRRGSRLDGADLVAEWQDDKDLRGASSHYAWDRRGLLDVDVAATDYLLGLFEADHMAYHLDADSRSEPTLPEMTAVAIAMLRKNPEGFFLFVEGGRIDHGHHENRAHKALDEAEQLHEAVRLAVELTNSSDTLVVVTSDHAHVMTYSGYPARGGPVLGVAGYSDVDTLPYSTLSYANGPGYKQPQKNGTRYDISSDKLGDKDYEFPAMVPLRSETHGGDDVAVFARGPWAHLFSGVYEQSVIPHLLGFAACVGPGITACSETDTLPWTAPEQFL
ncbi:membrane-bound alkaline phosphatase-like [Bacillus rossius redtenbacheri]|uniref:membrane-bound alkaline phosphatase-like n=1 Tax=Bacillus rossius redtenbacheri TaxID=93214 RepID=UPI002FDDDB15